MIRIVETTGSTNADLVAALTDGDDWVKEGAWLIANRQTAGRGRQGRQWHDGSGNFMGSTIIALDKDIALGMFNLTVAVALFDTVAEVLTKTDELSLKWPNDLVLRGAKLSGILSEIVGNHLVVGIGVNLDFAPKISGRETIALSDAAGHTIDRDHFAELLSAKLVRCLGILRESGKATIKSWWLERAHPIGTKLTVHDETGAPVSGEFSGIAPTGSMMLRLDNGQMRAIHAGDVSLLSEG